MRGRGIKNFSKNETSSTNSGFCFWLVMQCAKSAHLKVKNKKISYPEIPDNWGNLKNSTVANFATVSFWNGLWLVDTHERNLYSRAIF